MSYYPFSLGKELLIAAKGCSNICFSETTYIGLYQLLSDVIISIVANQLILQHVFVNSA